MIKASHPFVSAASFSVQPSNPVDEIAHLVDLTVVQIKLTIRLSNVIMMNLTGAFRKPHGFDYLGSAEISGLLQKYQPSRFLRIWSTSRSIGKQVYLFVANSKDSLQVTDRFLPLEQYFYRKVA